MEIKDTIEMMNSEDFKERFKAEYYQLKIRFQKLHIMIVKYKAGTLDFEPKCSLKLLKKQEKYMLKYLMCLDRRAKIEGIEL